MTNENVEKLLHNLQEEVSGNLEESLRKGSMERLKEVTRVYNGEDKVVYATGIIEKMKLASEELKIMSGWEGLDAILSGFRPEQLVVVSAATKSGKTSFLMDLTSRLGEFTPVWFPFEESAEELIRKYLERGEQPPNFCTPLNMKGNTIDWLELRIVESIVKFNTKIVIIDHLDYVVPFSDENHSSRVSQTMRKLKTLAKRWNIVIFLICHLVKTRMENQPTMEDLRGSSSIGQESDTVIFLWRQTRRVNGQLEISNNVNLSVQANRRTGRTGNIKMVFDQGKFYEKEWVTTRNDDTHDNF